MSVLAFGANTAATQRSKNQFLANAVQTASPATLLVMLFDRLVLDIARGEEAQRDGRRADAGSQLTHAQDIVSELMSTLEVDAWDGGPGLMAIYTFLMAELVRANVSGDPETTAGCRRIVEPLRDTWREAAAIVSGTAQPAGSGQVG